MPSESTIPRTASPAAILYDQIASLLETIEALRQQSDNSDLRWFEHRAEILAAEFHARFLVCEIVPFKVGHGR